jgi:hypothetical protein
METMRLDVPAPDFSTISPPPVCEEFALMVPSITQAPAEVNHSVRAHHKHGMSRLPHYEKCFKFKSENTTNDAAAEGTANHEIVEGLINAWLEERENQPANFSINDAFNMALAAGLDLEQGRVNAIRDVVLLLDRCWPSAVEMLIEERLTIYNPDGSELNYGTCDIVFLYENGEAILIDYKFGQAMVDDAKTNKQGYGYALALFQREFPGWGVVKSMKVVFIQPRINFMTEYVFIREDMSRMYSEILHLIIEADNPDAVRTPGDQCRYCAERGTCSALINLAGKIASAVHEMPMPRTFDPGLITDPEQMAMAYWYCKTAEPVIEAIKGAAKKMAQEGFELTTSVNGVRTTWELGSKNANRELGPSPLIYQEVKDIIDPEMYTAATDVRLGDLEKIFSERMVEMAKARGEKMTKKAAVEALNARLSAANLVTRSETRITFLKEVKQQPQTKVIDV